MNTLLSRINALFAFTLSVLAGLTFLCALSTTFKRYGDLVDIKISTSKSYVRSMPNFQAGRQQCDLGFLNFDLSADFTKAMDWNTKQLFLYLTAHYATQNNKDNQVVLWDYILLRGENPKLNLKSQNSKYYFWDDGQGLKGNPNITLTLSMNVIPNAGFLPLFTSGSTHRFAFPSVYES